MRCVLAKTVNLIQLFLRQQDKKLRFSKGIPHASLFGFTKVRSYSDAITRVLPSSPGST